MAKPPLRGNCGRSFSAHIEKKKSKCDYHFDRTLTDAEVQEIERRGNEVITANMPVAEGFMSRDEAAKHFSLLRLPDDAGDMLRIIRIGAYDACPCRGQHVHSTKEISGFKITCTSHENGVLRVRFRVEETGSTRVG